MHIETTSTWIDPIVTKCGYYTTTFIANTTVKFRFISSILQVASMTTDPYHRWTVLIEVGLVYVLYFLWSVVFALHIKCFYIGPYKMVVYEVMRLVVLKWVVWISVLTDREG